MLELQRVFESKTAQSILFMAVYDTILVIRDVNWTINELRPDHLYLKMPIIEGEKGTVFKNQSATDG